MIVFSSSFVGLGLLLLMVFFDLFDDLLLVHSVELVVVVADSRVMEDSTHVVHDFVLRDVRVIPCVDHARCDVLQNHGSKLSSRLVEDVGKMILW